MNLEIAEVQESEPKEVKMTASCIMKGYNLDITPAAVFFKKINHYSYSNYLVYVLGHFCISLLAIPLPEAINTTYPAMNWSLLVPRHTIGHCKHVELTILHKVLVVPLSSKIVETGVLKSRCFLCIKCMKLTSRSAKNRADLHIPWAHSKVYPRWSFPSPKACNHNIIFILIPVLLLPLNELQQ